jgi:type VI secretion system secreted protein Hcp
MSTSLASSRTRLLAIAVAAVVLALAAWQLAGPRGGTTNAGAAVGGVHISMTVNGQKQGTFTGDPAPRGAKGLIIVVAYQYELVSPRDAATGLPTGKRMHKPVTITHEMGGASPQFLSALADNENLKSVVINFFRTDRTGKDVNYYRVTLTNASVSDDRQYSSGNDVLEDVSFTFQRIQQDDLVAKTSFTDDWSSPID